MLHNPLLNFLASVSNADIRHKLCDLPVSYGLNKVKKEVLVGSFYGKEVMVENLLQV